MLNRCENQNNASYARYGGRGIVVCSRWKDSFASFLADIGRRPSPVHSIDRIDNDGPYSPENCRWATRRQQLTNYGRNRYLTLGRRTMTLDEWVTDVGINHQTIAARLDRGWTVNQALTIRPGARKAKPRGKDRKTHCANGHQYTAANSGRDSAGWRFCRTCNRERSREYMRNQRARARTKRKPKQL